MEQRILIYAPAGQDAALAGTVLAGSAIASHACRSPGELAEQLALGAGGVLTVDEALHAGVYSVLDAYARQQPDWSDLPIILLTQAGLDSLPLRQAIATLGNLTLLERPVHILTLITSAHAMLRARQRQYQVRETQRRKDEFLASLGHELRNPLAPILAVSEMLQLRHAEFDPGTRHAHQVIDRQARHLQVLVDELLDVARITTGRITLRKEVVPVRSILAAAQEQAQELIARRAHRFRPDTAGLPQWLCVEGDPARLIQVVSNLLSNAGKYTEPDGDIDMTVTFNDTELCIAVQDSGIGIASEMLPRIFDRFAQFDRNAESSRHGLGIGLTLAQRLVALHGGRITAHSEGPGKGSLFTVTLPRHDGAVPASTDASPASRRHSNLHTGRRVLIVDDNVDAAESLGMLLTMKGHEVHVVHEGSAVLSQARTFRPDVALLDLGLPGRDGFEVARDLREAPDLAGVMLIAVTGYGQEEDRRKTSDAGFAFHLIKPVDVAELLGLLSGGRSA